MAGANQLVPARNAPGSAVAATRFLPMVRLLTVLAPTALACAARIGREKTAACLVARTAAMVMVSASIPMVPLAVFAKVSGMESPAMLPFARVQQKTGPLAVTMASAMVKQALASAMPTSRVLTAVNTTVQLAVSMVLVAPLASAPVPAAGLAWIALYPCALTTAAVMVSAAMVCASASRGGVVRAAVWLAAPTTAQAPPGDTVILVTAAVDASASGAAPIVPSAHSTARAMDLGRTANAAATRVSRAKIAATTTAM